jgi:CheY-like chemotaxis protein
MIACTAHVDDYIRQEAKKKGFDEVFESPLQTSEILQIINSI